MEFRLQAGYATNYFISAEQYLRIAQVASPYKNLRRFLLGLAYFVSAGAIAFPVALLLLLPPVENWMKVGIVLLYSLPTLVMTFFGYHFLKILIDMTDLGITTGRLKLYRKP